MTSPRLALFLAQTTKALGQNFWRTSHNPYEDAVYEVLTRVGVMAWDENRQLGSDHVQEYHDMIKAHRAHAAVMIYGLCNERMCGVEAGEAARKFLLMKNSLDPERPQNGNHISGQEYNFPFCDIITESGSAELNEWHQQYPQKPISTGEHGFGNNYLLDPRGEQDRRLLRLGNVSSVFKGQLFPGGKGWGDLRPKQTIPFLLSSHGLGQWAMMDYYGEAYEGWPTIIKSRGHLDVAGFPRPTAWWYRTNYVANTNVSTYQKPLLKGDWEVQVRVMTPCQIFVSTPKVRVIVDGATHGVFNVSRQFGLLDLRIGSSRWPPPSRGPGACTLKFLEFADPESSPCELNHTFGCYDDVDGMYVQGGCRGVFECNGRNTTCECIGSQGFCSGKRNCNCDERRCPPSLEGAMNVTAIALDAHGRPVGKHHSLLASRGEISRLELVLDVPSPSTGTGTSLYLDGQDVAFIRAQLLDEHGVLTRNSDVNITYSVLSGPIRIVGTGSGNIRNHQPVRTSRPTTHESRPHPTHYPHSHPKLTMSIVPPSS